MNISRLLNVLLFCSLIFKGTESLATTNAQEEKPSRTMENMIGTSLLSIASPEVLIFFIQAYDEWKLVEHDTAENKAAFEKRKTQELEALLKKLFDEDEIKNNNIDLKTLLEEKIEAFRKAFRPELVERK